MVRISLSKIASEISSVLAVSGPPPEPVRSFEAKLRSGYFDGDSTSAEVMC